MRPTIVLISVITLLISVVGCGGNGSLTTDAKTTGDDTFILDLSTAQVIPQGNAPAVGSATRLVFRRIRPAQVVIGRYKQDTWAEEDERPDPPLTKIALSEYFIATTELTQEQWIALAPDTVDPDIGNSPWLELVESSTVTQTRLVGPQRPAVGITRVDLETVCQKNSPAGWRLRLPTPAEWQHAALAGATTRFSWGDAQGDEEVKHHANLWLLKVTEPRIFSSQDVAKLQANPFGLYDMHGNVWEMTAESPDVTYACGGAWDQPVLQARASNRLTIPEDAGLPTVGVRLVLVRE